MIASSDSLRSFNGMFAQHFGSGRPPPKRTPPYDLAHELEMEDLLDEGIGLMRDLIIERVPDMADWRRRREAVCDWMDRAQAAIEPPKEAA